MHPAVIAFWLASPDPSQPDWEEQRQAVFASAAAGEQWGTITSEPGSGGDIARTRSTATPVDAQPFLPGRHLCRHGRQALRKRVRDHGPDDHNRDPRRRVEDPTIFVLDVRDRPWDGSAGPHVDRRVGWHGDGGDAEPRDETRRGAGHEARVEREARSDHPSRRPLRRTLFTAVILGVLDEAIATAREQIRRKSDQLRVLRTGRVVASRAGPLGGGPGVRGRPARRRGRRPGVAFDAALRGKQAVADLAESAYCSAMTRVLGGGTFSQRSPFAHWFEDVRALGFLRPPWALAYDTLFATSIDVAITRGRRTPPLRRVGQLVRVPLSTSRRVYRSGV